MKYIIYFIILMKICIYAGESIVNEVSVKIWTENNTVVFKKNDPVPIKIFIQIQNNTKNKIIIENILPLFVYCKVKKRQKWFGYYFSIQDFFWYEDEYAKQLGLSNSDYRTPDLSLLFSRFKDNQNMNNQIDSILSNINFENIRIDTIYYPVGHPIYMMKKKFNNQADTVLINDKIKIALIDTLYILNGDTISVQGTREGIKFILISRLYLKPGEKFTSFVYMNSLYYQKGTYKIQFEYPNKYTFGNLNYLEEHGVPIPKKEKGYERWIGKIKSNIIKLVIK